MSERKSERPSPTAILNPRLDVNFKAIFTQETEESKIALMSFLSSVLGRAVKDLKLTANEPAASAPSQRQMYFDVAATFDDGEKADIEIQGRDRAYDYAGRSEIQAARLLTNNSKKGDEWNARNVYQISALNFHYKRSDKSEMSWYTMRDARGNSLAGRMNVIYVDLLTIKKLVGTPVESLTPLQKWGLYLSYADDESRADYVQRLAESERGIMEAKAIIGRMSEEESNWFRQNSIDTFWRDYNSEMSAMKKRGLERGLQEGIKQGLQEGHKQGLQEGHKQGLQEGHKQGLQEGIKQGRAEGARQKAVDAAKKLLADGKYGAEEIAALLQIPETAFAEA